MKSVGFLMPCHSTPWQNHLHKPRLDPIVKRKINGNVEVEEVKERMWMLSCEPRIKGLLSKFIMMKRTYSKKTWKMNWTGFIKKSMVS
ncbi:expressed protein [Phakopsora pachyrhizi]|uniref:Expressed protein n=1 Tax=Phakopsora pachyrhizi TaxID=170000 RepID=A0AAV0AHY5_PHAPC|nr:expressed protein [Phakopsora pachyrhizi]